jgi:hypothetical protein
LADEVTIAVGDDDDEADMILFSAVIQ